MAVGFNPSQGQQNPYGNYMGGANNNGAPGLAGGSSKMGYGMSSGFPGASPNIPGGGFQSNAFPGQTSLPNNIPANTANAPPGNAPAGYSWDPVQRGYVPTVGSAPNNLALQALQQYQQGQNFANQQKAFSMLTNTGGTPMTGPTWSQGAGPAAMPQMAPISAGQAQIAFPTAAITAGQQAAYNQAKDTQGQTTAAALNALRSQLAGRGMLGGGIEAQGTTGIVQQGAEALGNLTRQQAIDQGQQALQEAETAYQGGISQRGQDIGAQEAANQQALQSWSAQEAAREAQNQQALQGWLGTNQLGLQRQALLDNALTGLVRYA